MLSLVPVKVQRTQEAVLDSKAIKVIADYAAEKAEKLRTNTNQFDIGDFLKNVLSKLGHAEEVDMRRAGQLAFRFTLKPPTVGFLCVARFFLDGCCSFVGLTGWDR